MHSAGEQQGSLVPAHSVALQGLVKLTRQQGGWPQFGVGWLYAMGWVHVEGLHGVVFWVAV